MHKIKKIIMDFIEKYQDYQMINEAKQVGIIYQYVNDSLLENIELSNNLLSINEISDSYIAFTRLKIDTFDSNLTRISFDGDLLSNKYKIKPLGENLNIPEPGNKSLECIYTNKITNINKYIIDKTKSN